jgi:hypothetical protein
MYSCKQCAKSYTKFSNLKDHIYKTHALHNRTGVVKQDREIQPVEKPGKLNQQQAKIHICKYCNSDFTTSYSLDRHLKDRCKNKPIIITNRQNEKYEISSSMFQAIFDVFQYNMSIKSGQLDTGKTTNNSGMFQDGDNNSMTVDNHIENNTENNTENNITQNNNLYIREIHINPMGKESMSHISDATILQILNQGVNAVPALAKAIMELPENCNIVESDKRNHKATVVNRNGDIEIMDLNKALTMCATETVDRVDDYYEKFKDELPKQNKSIQRMARAHGLDSDEEEDDIPKDETYEAYFKKYMCQLKDTIDVNKKPILERINKYKEHKYKERTNKQGLQMLTS